MLHELLGLDGFMLQAAMHQLQGPTAFPPDRQNNNGTEDGQITKQKNRIQTHPKRYQAMPEVQASIRMSMEMCLANFARTQPMESMAKPQCMKNTR